MDVVATKPGLTLEASGARPALQRLHIDRQLASGAQYRACLLNTLSLIARGFGCVGRRLPMAAELAVHASHVPTAKSTSLPPPSTAQQTFNCCPSWFGLACGIVNTGWADADASDVGV
jgi:hypothetical protein